MDHKNTIRTFRVFTQPSVVDPTRQIVMEETTSGVGIEYTNYSVLTTLIHTIELQDAYNVGYTEGLNEALRVASITMKEYVHRVDVEREEDQQCAY